jgi:hypothetical protein
VVDAVDEREDVVSSSPLVGAERSTRLAPASRCLPQPAASVKRPVHSSTTSTPRAFHGSFAGSFSANTAISSPATLRSLLGDPHVGVEAAVNRVVAQEVGEGLGVREVVDGNDVKVVGPLLLQRPKYTPADAAEPVDRDLASARCPTPSG